MCRKKIYCSVVSIVLVGLKKRHRTLFLEQILHCGLPLLGSLKVYRSVVEHHSKCAWFMSPLFYSFSFLPFLFFFISKTKKLFSLQFVWPVAHHHQRLSSNGNRYLEGDFSISVSDSLAQSWKVHLFLVVFLLKAIYSAIFLFKYKFPLSSLLVRDYQADQAFQKGQSALPPKP